MQNLRHDEVELFPAVSARELTERRELSVDSTSFLGEVIYLIYYSFGTIKA